MNIAYFLTPKQEIASLFDDNTFRKGLETMRSRGFTAMPVTTRDNIYVGAVSTSDFLWYLVNDEYDEEDNFEIRTKTFSFKPMTPEEAILQMNLLGHTFFVFSDSTSEKTCVVYKRKDGNYGLIEPEN